MVEMLMERTDTGTPSDDAQEARRAGVTRRLRIKHCAPEYFCRLGQLSAQTWVADTDAPQRFIDESVDFRFYKSQPEAVSLAYRPDTEDTIDPDLFMRFQSFKDAAEDEFDDGLNDDDFDLNARLTPPPISWRPLKVKLRYVGRELPRIHIDPELEFDPEFDE